MDGYSVQEAASVLGVAEGRVWELLARGVLLGTPEGDSMRVFLKTQPGPIASAAHDEPPRTNGNGGTHGQTGEASAFRELLTEFRNLTERYGQALLALGESRGEVAGLRSRVDQLEARLDLRLPPPVDAAPMAWDSLSVPALTPEPSPPMPPPAAPRPRGAPRPPARRKPRPGKARSPREAVAGFADALARAQDPNAADLGESRLEADRDSQESAEATGAAVAAPDEAIQEAGEATDVAAEVTAEEVGAAEVTAEEVGAEEVAAEEVAAGEEIPDEQEAAVPKPVAAAEAAAAEVAVEDRAEAPTAEVEPPTYSTVVVEPDWFADGDFAWLDAAEMESSVQVAPPTPTPDQAEPEPESSSVATGALEEPEPEAQALQEPEAPGEAIRPPEPEPALDFESALDFEPAADFEPWQPPEPAAPEFPAEPADAEPVDAEAEVAEPVVAEPAVAEPAVAETAASDAPEPPTMSTAVAVEEVEEEVMWLGGEPDPSPIVRDEPRPEFRAEADLWPAVDAAPVVEIVRPPLAMTEDELARLALDEGWDDAEVAAIRAMITPPPSSTVDLPGAAELHEAMAALEAVPVQADPSYDVSRQWAKPAADDNEPARHDDWAFEPEPAPPPPTTSRSPSDVTSALRRTAADPGWLRRRQGPAAAAYRRLRRLFPG
ncbi:MAG: hypothetical protein WD402_04255 [Chloroflexota bacterium]